ncbi:MAG: GPO family capsid scaffolding protein [Pantoea sp.]|uniref:GPO family capsid scaffolding protein n=1 Tax=Pantoea piersonii TaxID=2364647 RepID=UPI0028A03AE4|nr:GPO family capsid scaffolding protein [Pantoea piersonii]MDU6432220.1 GPO family capsid scaffolding protein [Pantoea sp.]
MAKKAKRFRIGVEGATTDGRNIERSWLEQMAANYDPAVYTAVINMEHIKGYTPDSPFRRFGVVDALDTEEIQDGMLKGKLGLFATITPSDDLIDMTGKMQKLFTSMEISLKFADTDAPYLIGLAVTDDPASLGTEMLAFSASAEKNPLANRKQHPDNLFTAATETVIELEEAPEEKPALFTRIKAMFAKQKQTDDDRFSDVHQAVELIASEQQNYGTRTDRALGEQAERLSQLESSLQSQLDDLSAQKEAFTELKEQLERADSRADYRQRAPGGNTPAAQLTNC